MSTYLILEGNKAETSLQTPEFTMQRSWSTYITIIFEDEKNSHLLLYHLQFLNCRSFTLCFSFSFDLYFFFWSCVAFMFVYCVLQSCSSRSFVSFVKVYTISNVWGPFLLRLFPHLFSYLYQYTLSQIVIFVNTHCYKRSCSQTRRKEIICCKYRRMTGGRLGTYSPQVLCKMTIYMC